MRCGYCCIQFESNRAWVKHEDMTRWKETNGPASQYLLPLIEIVNRCLKYLSTMHPVRATHHTCFTSVTS